MYWRLEVAAGLPKQVARLKVQLGGATHVQVCAADGLPEVRSHSALVNITSKITSNINSEQVFATPSCRARPRFDRDTSPRRLTTGTKATTQQRLARPFSYSQTETQYLHMHEIPKSPVTIVAQHTAPTPNPLPVHTLPIHPLPIHTPPHSKMLLDWNLLWHALSNALTNACKYGDNRYASRHYY